jgi:2-polyprenyl-3-methyl-5-hydroxy-6-metoxy-1,4-benzoquinol methylase
VSRFALESLAKRYPEPLRTQQLQDVDRQLFHLSLLGKDCRRLADLGGGIGLFAPTCAAKGIETWLVDDFNDPVNQRFPFESLGVHDAVNVIQADIENGIPADLSSLDTITCFETIEHLHRTPRPLLELAFRALRPGGHIIVSGPNAVNLRKRLAVLTGRSNWSRFDDWFYEETFRGHVREPVVHDLRRMLEETGFIVQRVWGRNWALRSVARVGSVLDIPLRLVPSLCSTLYVRALRP